MLTFISKSGAWEYIEYMSNPHHEVTLRYINKEIKKRGHKGELFNIRNFPSYDLISPFPLDELFKTSTRNPLSQVSTKWLLELPSLSMKLTFCYLLNSSKSQGSFQKSLWCYGCSGYHCYSGQPTYALKPVHWYSNELNKITSQQLMRENMHRNMLI